MFIKVWASVIFAFTFNILQQSTATSKNPFDDAYLRFVERETSFILDRTFGDYSLDFCPLVIKPNEKNFQHALQTMITTPDGKKGVEEVYTIDQTCRECLKCDFEQRLQLNLTKDAFPSKFMRHCKCERVLQLYVQAFHLVTGGFIPFVFSLSSKQCYSIVKCKKYQFFFEPKRQFDEFPYGRGTESIRCLEYELDTSKPKIYQVFDVPFFFKTLIRRKLWYVEDIERLGMETIINSLQLKQSNA